MHFKINFRVAQEDLQAALLVDEGIAITYYLILLPSIESTITSSLEQPN